MCLKKGTEACKRLRDSYEKKNAHNSVTPVAGGIALHKKINTHDTHSKKKTPAQQPPHPT